jgi:uncharacterized protein YjbI with pentapeptide repeats
MSNAKALTARWRSEPGATLAEEVVARLVAGRPLEGLGLDEYEGRIDLRCLPAPTPRRLERFESLGWFVETLGDVVTLRGVALARLDLSGAHLQSLRFHDATIRDCRFEGAACRDWRLWGTRVTGCSFAKADLRGAAVGTWHQDRRNEWRQVDFTGADFRVAVSQAALFEGCKFDAAKLVKVRFEQCALVCCHFAGALSEVVFDGRELPDRAAPHPMEDVDFTEAQFDQVELLGCKLDRVIIPADPDISLIRRYGCVVEHALALIDDDDSQAARMLRGEFQNTLRMMRGVEEDNLFNRRDYLASGVDVATLATTVFTRAQAECGV